MTTETLNDTFDKAFDEFADMQETILEAYNVGDLDGMEAELKSSRENFLQKVSELLNESSECEDCKKKDEEIEELKEELDEQEETARTTVTIQIQSLAQLQKIEDFIRKEIYPFATEEQFYTLP